MAVTLELLNVSKIFRKDRELVRAVDNVSMTVAPGEMVTFLGPSGCGKTTTLRMVAGFETPSGGTITIDGQDVTLTITRPDGASESVNLLCRIDTEDEVEYFRHGGI